MHGADLSGRRIDVVRVRLLRVNGFPHSEQSAVPGDGFAEFGGCILYSREFQSGEELDKAVSLRLAVYKGQLAQSAT